MWGNDILFINSLNIMVSYEYKNKNSYCLYNNN